LKQKLTEVIIKAYTLLRILKNKENINSECSSLNIPKSVSLVCGIKEHSLAQP